MSTPTREQIDETPAGPELDALVATYVFGLEIVHDSWPCGIEPDNCIWTAHSYPDQSVPSWFDTLWPVYKASNGVWPAQLTDWHGKEIDGIEPWLRVDVEPVPHYSTDIAAAFSVLVKFKAYKLDKVQNFGLPLQIVCWVANSGDVQGRSIVNGDKPALAICRAALKAVIGQLPQGEETQE